ncbi:hypothetical protein QE152_g34175 [Popillia japonica]|uniref:Uncharacterized protein n=1 Tax=Popillia japonica TaxID=7064 RepID=A0AAW1IUA1_POPJA
MEKKLIYNLAIKRLDCYVVNFVSTNSKMDEGNGVPADMKFLFKANATIPISTIGPPLVKFHPEKYVRWTSTVGPPLVKFHPEKYVRSWLAKGHHSASDTNRRKRTHKEDTRYQEQ